MVGNGGKSRRQIQQERTERERATDEEMDTVYWLVFTPQPGIVIAPDEQPHQPPSPWRVLLPGNPEHNPELIQLAIIAFEQRFNVASWAEIAGEYKVKSLYFP